MQKNFDKYESLITNLITESDVLRFLINENFQFAPEITYQIRNSENTVKSFFIEFKKLKSENKYEHLVELTRESSDWISVYLNDSAEAEEKRENFNLLMQMIQIQNFDLRESLALDEAMLYESRRIELIDKFQFDTLKCSLERKGQETTKIEFLLSCMSKSIECYGKLLCLFHKSQSKFIPTFLKDLQKELDKLSSDEDEEAEGLILAYAASMIDLNKNKVRVGESSVLQAAGLDRPVCVETEPVSSTTTVRHTMSKSQDREQFMQCFETDYPIESSSDQSVMLSNPEDNEVTFTDHLELTEDIVQTSENAGLLTEEQLTRITKALKSAGDDEYKRVRSQFFTCIQGNHPDDWYGHLLYVTYIHRSEFIPIYLPDLHSDLQSITGEDEKRSYIRSFGNSIQPETRKQQSPRFMETDGIPVDNSARSSDGGLATVTMTTKPVKSSPLLGSAKSDWVMLSDKECRDVFSLDLGDDITMNRNSLSTHDQFAGKETGAYPSRPSKIAADVKDDEDSSDDNDSNSDFDELFGLLKNKKATDILNFNINENNVQKVENKVLEMRPYQTELAEKGIQGKNVLICSPTGSGKTLVAVKIVEEHLATRPNAKVAFLVHRLALVEQQFKQFSQYLKCRITRLSGSAKSSSTPLIGHLDQFDVFVLTSDILKNALEGDIDTRLQSINAFTLVLFDECHNCDKKHPYNRIMTHYFKDKKAHKKLPQIIGLTASTGTNKANTMDKAIKRLYALCANLDTYLVSTVDIYKKELEESQSKPKQEILKPSLRLNDKFDELLQKQMMLCERMLLEMNARNFFPKDTATQALLNIPEDRLHQKYQGFVGKLGTELYNKTDEKLEGKKSVYTISCYLNAFVRALMVNHLFRSTDAVKLIKDILELEFDNPETCPVEMRLRRSLQDLGRFQNAEHEKNPSLECLKDQIVNQLENDPGSRIIVFVRERNYTQILKSIFSSVSDQIKCDTVVGNTISAEQGGLTQNEMEEVLGRFRRGDLNVLFSTTVAEEGLDIQKCNLVIRYGHVTNETAMVQSRGRARAQDSRYIVIVPYKLQWQVNKENINRYRESMMYRAIERFQKMDPESVKFEIKGCQAERELQETCDLLARQSLSNKQSSNDVWNFSCKKCTTLICKSSDIRLAEDAHHIVITQSCFQRMIVFMVQNKNSCQIKCKKCNNVLGNRQKFKNRLFPTLKIDSFSLNCEGVKQFQSFKKWKDVPFVISEFTATELLNFKMDHELAV